MNTTLKDLELRRVAVRRRRFATKLGGTPSHPVVFRFPVTITFSGIGWSKIFETDVVAPSPRHVSEFIKRIVAPTAQHPFEIDIYGVRGGIRSYFCGWENSIAYSLLASGWDRPVQLEMSL